MMHIHKKISHILRKTFIGAIRLISNFFPFFITCTGKKDGAGAQIHAVISTIALARACNMHYIHQPFTEIDHATKDKDIYVKEWEKFMNLGAGELKISSIKDVIPKGYIRCISVWHCHFFIDFSPETYTYIQENLRKKYFSTTKPQLYFFKRGYCNIALHIRRGDVTAVINNVRYTPDGENITFLDSLINDLEEHGIPYIINIFSEGCVDDFIVYRSRYENISLHLDGDPFTTFHHLVSADIFIMAKSSFSYSAALLSEGIILYQDFWHPPLPDWVNVKNRTHIREKIQNLSVS